MNKKREGQNNPLHNQIGDRMITTIKNKKVGVIIPIHNVEKYLKECLDSVLNQTYKNLEVLLIDDGSTDASLEIAKEYAKKDSCFTLFTKENGGQSGARNVGIEFLSNEYVISKNPKSDSLYSFRIVGKNPRKIHSIYSLKQTLEVPQIDFLIFLDSDDSWDINCIQKCVTALNSKKCEIVWFHLSFIYKLNYKNNQVVTTKRWLQDMLENQIDYFFCVWGCMVRFDFLKKINLKFLDGVMKQDHLFGICLFTQANNIYVLREPLYKYRLSPNSTTRGSTIPNGVISNSFLGGIDFGIDDSLIEYFRNKLKKQRYKSYYRSISKIIVIENIYFFISTLKNDEIRKLAQQVFTSQHYLQQLMEAFSYSIRKRFTAKSRIKSQLSYRLGSKMILNSKSLWGYIKMPFAIAHICYQYKKEQKEYQRAIARNPNLKLPTLESYSDYKEALKYKGHLSFKLGQALIESQNVGGGHNKIHILRCA